jgi:CheY-like chemotaxis protein
MLRAHRADWDCHFVDDPLRALDLLDEIAPDAVVSDMLMPGLDGAEFLTEAARRRPLMARFILSGEVGAGSLVRMARAAHQCLAKPCRGDVLMDVLRRALVEPSAVKAPALMAGLYGIHGLPLAAPLFDQLRRQLSQPPSDLRDRQAVALIEGSAAIATKVLQVATWTRLGMGAPPAHVYDAYFQLGPESVWSLLDADLLRPLPGGETTPFQRDVWRRCEQVPAVAHAIAIEEGFSADDGRQAASRRPVEHGRPLSTPPAATTMPRCAARQWPAVPLPALERLLLGSPPPRCSAQMLRLWVFAGAAHRLARAATIWPRSRLAVRARRLVAYGAWPSPTRSTVGGAGRIARLPRADRHDGAPDLARRRARALGAVAA